MLFGFGSISIHLSLSLSSPHYLHSNYDDKLSCYSTSHDVNSCFNKTFHLPVSFCYCCFCYFFNLINYPLVRWCLFRIQEKIVSIHISLESFVFFEDVNSVRLKVIFSTKLRLHCSNLTFSAST